MPGEGGGLLRLQAEQEHILVTQHLVHFHVGPVQGADSRGAVHHELHIAGTAGLFAGSGDLLGYLGWAGMSISAMETR